MGSARTLLNLLHSATSIKQEKARQGNMLLNQGSFLAPSVDPKNGAKSGFTQVSLDGVALGGLLCNVTRSDVHLPSFGFAIRGKVCLKFACTNFHDCSFS